MQSGKVMVSTSTTQFLNNLGINTNEYILGGLLIITLKKCVMVKDIIV